MTPLSRLRSPACAALTWLMVGLPVSVGVVAGVLLMKIYRGTAVRRIGLRAALVLLIFWLLRMAASPFWSRHYSYEVRGVQYSDVCAEPAVKGFLPPQSRDICAWIRPLRSAVVASFRIDEGDFIAWARQKQWDLREVHGVEVHGISANCDMNDSVPIRDGWLYQWTYDPAYPWRFFRVCAYDRRQGLGYITEGKD